MTKSQDKNKTGRNRAQLETRN